VKDTVNEAKLEKLIRDMDLPFNRKNYFNPAKLKWLQKNMETRNSTHKNYAEALKIVEILIENG
jgi:hypothetical protein